MLNADDPRALSYCIDVLRAREQTDNRYGWLWNIKRHTAEHCLAWQRIRCPQSERRQMGSLTNTDKAEIERHHSLLRDSRAAETVRERYSGQPWFEELLSRVSNFVMAKERKRTA